MENQINSYLELQKTAKMQVFEEIELELIEKNDLVNLEKLKKLKEEWGFQIK